MSTVVKDKVGTLKCAFQCISLKRKKSKNNIFSRDWIPLHSYFLYIFHRKNDGNYSLCWKYDEEPAKSEEIPDSSGLYKCDYDFERSKEYHCYFSGVVLDSMKIKELESEKSNLLIKICPDKSGIINISHSFFASLYMIETIERHFNSIKLLLPELLKVFNEPLDNVNVQHKDSLVKNINWIRDNPVVVLPDESLIDMSMVIEGMKLSIVDGTNLWKKIMDEVDYKTSMILEKKDEIPPSGALSIEQAWHKSADELAPTVVLKSAVAGGMIKELHPEMDFSTNQYSMAAILYDYFYEEKEDGLEQFDYSMLLNCDQKLESDEQIAILIEDFKQIVETKLSGKNLKDLTPADGESLTNEEKDKLIYVAYQVSLELSALLKINLGIGEEIFSNEIYLYNDIQDLKEPAENITLTGFISKKIVGKNLFKSIWREFVSQTKQRILGMKLQDLLQSFVEGEAASQIADSQFPEDHLYHSEQQKILKNKFINAGWCKDPLREGVLYKDIKFYIFKRVEVPIFENKKFIRFELKTKKEFYKSIRYNAYFGIDNGWRKFIEENRFGKILDFKFTGFAIGAKWASNFALIQLRELNFDGVRFTDKPNKESPVLAIFTSRFDPFLFEKYEQASRLSPYGKKAFLYYVQHKEKFEEMKYIYSWAKHFKEGQHYSYMKIQYDR